MLSLKLKIAGAEPLLRGNEHMWSVVRSYGVGGTFTATDIHGRTNGARRTTVRTYLTQLVAIGHIAKAGEARNGSIIYRVAKAPAEPPRIGRDGTARSITLLKQMWSTIRSPLGRSGFSARDIAAYSSLADAPVSVDRARRYLRCLDRAGYLQRLTTTGAAAEPRWRLKPAMNTGPKPPAVLTATLMYDRNRNEVIGETIADEVSP